MHLSEFDYTLPEELIAQKPLDQRDASRLMVVDRRRASIQHRSFADILDYLRDDDLLVMNDTRVTALRLAGHKETGGKVEALVMKRLRPGLWEAMVKPGRRVAVGTRLVFDAGLTAVVADRTPEGGRILQFDGVSDPDTVIAETGQTPLPPYIRVRLDDSGRYQTVYAVADGSAAAPTAGLHFTPQLLDSIRARGIQTVFVTLHIGIATFRPVRAENIEDHDMHTEVLEISEQSADIINSASGRIVCVGTTTARALESAAVAKRRIAAGSGETQLFIRPTYEFQVVEALLTNFHMPRSTLLMLVSAFAGVELVRRAYAEAVRHAYRFLSFGDAMFLY